MAVTHENHHPGRIYIILPGDGYYQVLNKEKITTRWAKTPNGPTEILVEGRITEIKDDELEAVMAVEILMGRKETALIAADYVQEHYTGNVGALAKAIDDEVRSRTEEIEKTYKRLVIMEREACRQIVVQAMMESDSDIAQMMNDVLEDVSLNIDDRSRTDAAEQAGSPQQAPAGPQEE